MDGNGAHFLLLLVVLLSWFYTVGNRGRVRLGNPFKQKQCRSTTKLHRLSTCSLGRHCMNQRPPHGPPAVLRCLFGLNSLFLFSLFYFMLPSLSFLDFLQHILQRLGMREAQSSQNSLFYYVIVVCLRLALSSQLSAGIAGMHMGPGVYSF